MTNFPILSVITFLPILAAAIILMMPANRKNEIRAVALAAATLDLLLSGWLYLQYLLGDMTGYQFIEQYNWLPALGISLKFGVDGMSTPLVLLTGIVMFTGVLISWGDEDPHVKAGIQDRPREFFAFLFLLAGGVFGVFVSLDLFMLFFFYEIAVFPMYLLIAIWGWVKTREYAAMKLTLYLFIGSVVALVGALAMYWTQYQNTGVLSFDMLLMENAKFSPTFQYVWFLPVFLGFAVLGGIWPFHNWSPDGHVAAPTAVSMFHAGVLMKLGAFAALRVGVMLLPEGAKDWAWLLMLFAGVAVVYGAFIAFVQTDMKYMIGFSSVSHMGLVVLGVSTLNHDGLVGAGVQMFSHGVMTALFFAVTGMIYDRAHTRMIPELGGIAKVMPFATVGFIIGGLVSMGMPGFSGFVAEFPIFMGVWGRQWLVAVIASISIVITAAYIMINIRKVFFSEMPENLHGHIGDVTMLDKIAITTLCLFMIVIGMFPAVMVPMVEKGVENVLRLLGGA
ncbi:MAG TPA: NADH-quinone oxidoreductase subunit M [Anaerolineales bacterium]|nr:NADH-quinone oxidoreductase subunit M [Anaerolineales bacterium]HNE67617.1 NADH-quinone oxidoreductase subunit M [Anaerolineales bacterium]